MQRAVFGNEPLWGQPGKFMKGSPQVLPTTHACAADSTLRANHGWWGVGGGGRRTQARTTQVPGSPLFEGTSCHLSCPGTAEGQRVRLAQPMAPARSFGHSKGLGAYVGAHKGVGGVHTAHQSVLVVEEHTRTARAPGPRGIMGTEVGKLFWTAPPCKVVLRAQQKATP
jgi:hypothetical protein